MKLFSLFAPKKEELFEGAIETWIVEWAASKPDGTYSIWRVKKKYQAFTSKNEAEEFRRSLEMCFKTIRGGGVIVGLYKDAPK